MAEVTKESLAQWIAELESQPHLSLKEERYLAVCKALTVSLAMERKLRSDNAELLTMLDAREFNT